MDNSRNNVKINFIEPNTKVIGEIHSQSDFRIDGTLEGSIQTTGRVVIGKEGVVKGKISCTNSDIMGRFNGHIEVSNLLSIKSEGLVEGEVTTGKLSVEVGALLNAQCVMKKAVKTLQPSHEKTKEKTA